MVRVLHVVGSMHPGGIENFIMNLYRNIDRSKVQFDFITHTESDPAYVKEIESLGGKLYRLPRLTGKPIANLRGIKRIVKEGGYAVVVRHTPNALIAPQVFMARRGGAVSACHSHSTSDPKKFVHRIGKAMMKCMKVERFACSEDAGKWMYGKRPFKVIRNAIDIERFAYRMEAESRIRTELGVEPNQALYGHVANFIECKNHTFLMEVYSEIAKLDDGARFVCLGDGDLKAQTMEKAKALGIADKVFFVGVRSDANDFMSAMNVLIFPSIFEGLPLTLIEAQAAGLPCLISDTITDTVEVTKGLVHPKSLSDGAKEWAKEAVSLCAQGKEMGRECQRQSIADAGYDVKALASWYEDYFEEQSRK